jgi:hypothetical protein
MNYKIQEKIGTNWWTIAERIHSNETGILELLRIVEELFPDSELRVIPEFKTIYLCQ